MPEKAILHIKPCQRKTSLIYRYAYVAGYAMLSPGQTP
jgi:hypothetical protein